MGRLRHRLSVVVATPLGQGGMGGVDRVTDMLRDACRTDPDVTVAFVTTRGPGSIVASPLYLIMAILNLAALRLAGRADLLHINLGQKGSTLRKLTICGTARLLGTPYVLHLHGAGYRDYWDRANPVLARAIEAMFVRAAAVIVLGSVWSDYIRCKVPEATVVVLPNATPAPDSPPPRLGRAEPHMLFLGEVGPRKGVLELIAALKHIEALPWRATIAGNGQVEAARAQAAAAGLTERISFPGWIGPLKVKTELADADILVLPSHEENLPMSVIEGMAYGLAVVASPVGAVGDIVEDGVTGLLCEPGDIDALARALRRTLESPELRSRLGSAARAFHRRHLDADAYYERLKALWFDAGEARRPTDERATAG